MVAVALLLLALVVRAGVVSRQGMWADEVFSVAMATGHSLEHPAERADPAKGDFVQGPAVGMPPGHWSSYARHDNPPAGPRQVVRAVFLSDTNPPLYYLTLWAWTLAFGTGDAVVKALSVTFAMACFPLVWVLARRLGGGRESCAVAAGVLFALAPLCAYYSVEARMYSMMWFFALASVLLSLRLHARGITALAALLWILCAALGLYTHYFFVFPLAACVAWLLLFPGRAGRLGVLGLAAVAGLLALPWYALFPVVNSQWRVTAGWLKIEPATRYNYLKGVRHFAWSSFSGVGEWGGRRILDAVVFATIVWATVLVLMSLRGVSAARLRERIVPLLLPVAVIAAAILGPVVIDVAQATYLTSKSRYGSAALLPALVLLGVVLGRLRGPVRTVALGAIVLAWLPSTVGLMLRDSHHWSPFNKLARHLVETAGANDVVIIHSIPSGLAGVSRYMPEAGPPAVASWVGQLDERRTPDDLLSIIDGKARVHLLKVHDVYEPAPQEQWLRANAVMSTDWWRGSGYVAVFKPRDADTFDAGALRRQISLVSATRPATTRATTTTTTAPATAPTSQPASGWSNPSRAGARGAARKAWRGTLDAIQWLNAATTGFITLLAVWLCMTRPAERAARRVRHWLGRIGRRPIVAAAVVVGVVLLINAALAVARWPQPRIHDEFSHLLTADTLAHGRVTNAPHPMWRHFESFHTIHQPTYASKYPPGPGWLMGVGQKLTGRPIVGAWMGVALAALATWWMLRALVRPRWALLATLLFATHSLALYWARSYIGGAFGMAAGALLLGGLLRTLRGPPRVTASLAMAVGLAALAVSRPGEGLILCLILGVAAAVYLRKSMTRPTASVVVLRIVAPMAIVLVPFAAAMAYYNWRVTGNPIQMPYMLHAQQYSVAPNYTFLPRRDDPPEYRHEQLREFHAEWEMDAYNDHRGASALIDRAYWKLRWLFTQVFTPDALYLLLVPAVLAWRRSASVHFALTILVAFLVVVALAQVWINTHYLAPAGALLVVVLLAGLRRLRAWRWRGIRAGRVAVRTIIVMHVAVTLGWAAWAAREWGWQYFRADVVKRLTREGGRHLILVRYPLDHDVHEEWVANGADIDAQRVVWAREMGPADDAELIKYYAGRKVWRLEPVPRRSPQLERYDARTAATAPSTAPADTREPPPATAK